MATLRDRIHTDKIISLAPKQDAELITMYPDGSVLILLTPAQVADLIARLTE